MENTLLEGSLHIKTSPKDMTMRYISDGMFVGSKAVPYINGMKKIVVSYGFAAKSKNKEHFI